MSKTTHKPKDFEYEFFGPIGATVLVIFLPIISWVLFAFCGPKGCPSFSAWEGVHSGSFLSIENNPIVPKWLPSTEAVYTILGWFLFQLVIHLVLPGNYYDGVPLPNGKRLSYKSNAFLCATVSFLVLMNFQYVGWIDLGKIYDMFPDLLMTTIYFSFFLSVVMYLTPVFTNELTAVHGSTGIFIYDFWMGKPLNPRTGPIDWKYFCELRPGLIGWSVINVAMAIKQYQNIGYVTNSMVLVCLFQGYYVADALFKEPALLTTMDITTEGFGFMLVFGDLVWVPFTYSLQSRYLVENPLDLSTPFVALILLTKIVGYIIFRGSNSQKDVFRKNPNHPSVSHLKYLETKTGSRLLISGWWGMARHINYFGDWLMGLAWCLPTGFGTLWTYYYAIYFAVLLIHREFRDEHKCHNKYQSDWEKYCKIVKWRIVPYIF